MVVLRFLISFLLIYSFILNIDKNLIFAKVDTKKIFATTSLISSILYEIGKDKINIVTIIPPNICPGHFDLKPKDASNLSCADLILGHKFQKENFLKKISSLAKRDTKILTIDIEENWMVPDVYIRAVDEITDILKEEFPYDSKYFRKNASEYKKRIRKEIDNIKRETSKVGFDRINVVADKMQKDLLKWFGLNVVSVYPREEEITPQELKEVIRKAKINRANLVVGNLQSEGKIGRVIAEELNIPYIILTNFPKNYGEKISYLDTLKEIAHQLFNLKYEFKRANN